MMQFNKCACVMTLSYANYVFSGHKETKNTLKFAKQLIFRNR